MQDKRRKRIILLINIALPLIAVIALGVSSYIWYKVLEPDKIPPPVILQSKVSPKAFSAGLNGNLIETLSDFGIEEQNLTRKDIDTSIDTIRHVYTIRVPEKASLTLINLKITSMAKNMGGSVFSGIEGSNGKTLTITLGSGKIPTDIVVLKKVKGIELIQAKMAIIIDDLGIKSLNSAQRLCRLGQTVTLSILPFQRRTSKVVELAVETGTPYMLHMPMEPMSSKANPGKGAILTEDSKSQVIEKLEKAFRDVRGARGINNHMGSKATENVRSMEMVMNFLDEHNYFFIDSKTSLNTAGYRISQISGVKSAIIDGYLDVSDDRADIEKKLDYLAQNAFSNGYAVAICHDRANTVAVLERMLPELEKKGIKFVEISELIR